MVTKDKELRDIIQKDIDRTMQDVDFFTSEHVKGQMFDILYLWAKDNNEFGYRQGMNEILAMVVHAIFEEVVDDSSLQIEVEEEITNQQIVQLVFGESKAWADVYWLFDRIMALGIKNLYSITKDIGQLKQELLEQLDPPANKQSEQTQSQ